jgi:hypothetical protein
MWNISSLNKHAWKIACILESIFMNDLDEKWEHIRSWLHMGSAVIDVKLDTARYDSSIVFCSTAADYANESSVYLSNLSRELTTFSFIWGAFEAIVEILIPTATWEKYGKVNSACYFLKQKYREQPLDGYKFLLKKLISIYGHVDCKKSFLNLVGQGIYIVYRIRNKFAHGSLSFGYHSEEYKSPEYTDVNLINLSSRIVLLTIQMMLIANFNGKSIKLSHLYMFDELRNLQEIEITSLLKVIHFSNYDQLLK